MLDAATGRRYREAILEAGGSRPAMESFKAFRGREPTHRCAAAPPGHGLRLPPARRCLELRRSPGAAIDSSMHGDTSPAPGSDSDAQPAPLRRPLRVPRRHAGAVALGALFAALPAQALYKVVGPDGKVTYTDRAARRRPSGKVTPLSATGSAADREHCRCRSNCARSRRATRSRCTSIADCAPCDSARALLRQRGIPYAERQIVQPSEDAEALQRLTGARDAPTLTIGAQPLRGLSRRGLERATSTAAGYPRESRLPRGLPVRRRRRRCSVEARGGSAEAAARRPTPRRRTRRRRATHAGIRF